MESQSTRRSTTRCTLRFGKSSGGCYDPGVDVRGVAAAWFALCVACTSSTEAFVCAEDTQCDGGQCEVNGYCSFPSADCESGKKYGSLSPTEIAGMCVPVMGSTGEVDPTLSMATSSGSTEGEASTSSKGETTEGLSGGSSSTGFDPTFGSSTSVGPTSSTSIGSSSTGSEQPDAELRVWYRMNDAPDDGVLDDGPFGFDGACTNVLCPDFDPTGPDGGAYNFNTSYFQHPHNEAFEVQLLTIAAVVRWNGTGPQPQQIIAKPVGIDILNSWQLQFTTFGGVQSIQFVLGDDTGVQSIYMPVPANEWIHVAATYDGTTARGYLNGELLETAVLDSDIGYDDSPLIVGADRNFGDTFTLFLNGSIGDLRLYAGALNDTEIAQLAAELP